MGKILTRKRVKRLGLDKVAAITPDMLEGYTSIGSIAFYDYDSLTSATLGNEVTKIGDGAFSYCHNLTSVTLGNNVTYIGVFAFYNSNRLTSVTIGNKTYKLQTVTNDKCKAYKAFNSDMTCRNFQYEEGKNYELGDELELILNGKGFHACLNLIDVFNYYWGEFGKNIVIHEVELEEISIQELDDSTIVAKKITIGKRIL